MYHKFVKPMWGVAFAFLGLLLILSVSPASAQTGPEIRAYWIDAFAAGFKSTTQVNKLISDVRAANMNTVIVQMRRRGDTYYPSAYEPWAPDANQSFDALAYLIQQAHNGTPRVDVHCWFCTYPCWNSDVAAPTAPNHVMNTHPEWLTQDINGRLNDNDNPNGEHKYFLDPAVPGVQQHIYNVVMDVVNRYDVDGINFDYIRYASNIWGYNPTAVARFNALYGRTGTPTADDSAWRQFRRDQITALLRKIYANAIAVKPGIKVSADTITWGNGPTDATWTSTSAYASCLQDWRAWMEEGILDLNVTMTYYNYSQYPTYWNNWINYQKSHKYNRQLVIGQGSWLNTIDNIYNEINTTRASYNGYTAEGQAYYDYNEPYAGGVGQATQFACDLASTSCRPVPTYPVPVPVPDMPWKSSPTKGHVKGTVLQSGAWVDGATVTINTTPSNRTLKSDPTGFYAFIDVAPGNYTVTVTYPDSSTQQRSVSVTAGAVSTVDFDTVDLTPPVVSAATVAEITATTAVITWITDDAATSQVEYGLTQAYGTLSPLDPNYVLSHSVLLTNLTPLTLYHFRIKTRNAGGLETVTRDYAFMTLSLTSSVEVIVDNADGAPTYTTTGTWTTSSATANRWGPDYDFASTAPTVTATATFQPNLPYTGPYKVYVWYNTGTNRSVAAPFTIHHTGGTTTYTVNQQQNGGMWVKLGPTDSTVNFNAGNAGKVVLSNGTGESKVVMSDAVRFEYVGTTDTSAPTVPGGFAASGQSTSSIGLSWQPSTDNTGVVGYKIYVNDELRDAVTGTSYVISGLQPNESASVKVAAYDASGNTSAFTSTLMAWSLPAAPTPASITCSRSKETWYASGTFDFTAVSGFGTGTASSYRYAFDTSPTHTWTGSESAWSAGTLLLTPPTGSSSLYLHLRSYNGGGQPGGTLDIGPYYYDPTPPAAPTVTDEGLYTDRSTLIAAISAQDAESGITAMKYAVGTVPGASNTIPWTNITPSSQITRYNVGLTIGQTYYVSVQAKNAAGTWSSNGISNGITAAQPVATITALRGTAENSPVILTGKTVSANLGADGVYAQESARCAGIKISASSTAVSDNIATIAGRYSASGGAAVLGSGEVRATDDGSGGPVPLWMQVISLGGADASGGLLGVPGAVGPYNIGLLARTAGKVETVGTGFFTLSDGSGASVKVYSSASVNPGAAVGVTGVSLWELDVSVRIRVIRTRGTGDVTIYRP